QARLTAEPHRAHAQSVRLFHDLRLQLGQFRIRIHIVQRAEKLPLRQIVPMCAIAPDAHAQRTRRATLPLRLPYRMQDALADTLQIAVGAPQVVQIARHRVLNVLVLAAAALEDQLHLDLVLLPMLEMHHRRLFAQVVAAVLPGQRIHRIRAQFAQPRRLRHRRVDRLPDADLVHAHRRVHHERRHPRVLADRPLVFHRHIDIAEDDVKRLRGLRLRRLLLGRERHRRAHIGRKVGGCLDNQFQQTGGKKFHNRLQTSIVSHWDRPSPLRGCHTPLPHFPALSGRTGTRVRPTWPAVPQSMPATRRRSESRRPPATPARESHAPPACPPRLARCRQRSPHRTPPAFPRRSRDSRTPPPRAPALPARPPRRRLLPPPQRPPPAPDGRKRKPRPPSQSQSESLPCTVRVTHRAPPHIPWWGRRQPANPCEARTPLRSPLPPRATRTNAPILPLSFFWRFSASSPRLRVKMDAVCRYLLICRG